jgi:DNA repair exonuclease SbcCD ATPase subunit
MSGINFIELGWRNFLSYGNNLNVIALDFTKPTVICGKNIDSSVEGQIDSNGAGKSTILNALSYVLFDKTIADIKKDNLINWINEKNMEVYVIFEKNKTYYKVERFRKFSKKGGDGIRILTSSTNNFTEDNYKDITRDSVGRANEQLVEILGIPFDVFARVVLFSSATESFFALPASSAAGKTCQKDILEELFGYTEISNKSETLSKKIKDDKKELERLFELNKQILDESDRLKSQIEFAETQSQKWVQDHKLEIKKLNEEIKKQEEVDFDEEKLIYEQIKKIDLKIQEKALVIKEKDLLAENVRKAKNIFTAWENKKVSDIETIKKSIEKYASLDFSTQFDLYKALEDITGERDQLAATTAKQIAARILLEQSINKNDSELKHLADNKCPYCLQDFKNVKDKITELTTSNTKLKAEVDLMLPTAFENENKIKALSDSIIEKRKQLLFSSKDEMIAKKVEAESLAQKLIDKTTECNPHPIQTEEIDTKEVDSLNAEIVTLKAKIDKFKCVQKFSNERDLYNAESSLDSNKKLLVSIKAKENPHILTLNKLKETKLPENKNTEIETMKDDLEHEEFLYKLLTKKDSYIRKALLNKNLPFLNGRLKHHLNKTGLPHKVVFTENMSAAISQFGTQIEYSNLSTGQKARINLATSFAFRDVLQTRHEKINLCMLDEYLDSGLSDVGVKMAIKMVKEIAREEQIPIFIISHREEVATMFDSKIEVEMNNKFSNIVKSDVRFSTTE